MSSSASTIEIIKVIARALGDLNDQAVFVGGATVAFYLPDAYQSQIRPTEDIDVVMEIVGRKQNAMNEQALRDRGFKHDTSEDAPICRWIYGDFKVDVMSTDTSALGFTNCWYKEGVENSTEALKIPVSVKILSLPYFIATKIEAFKSRGNSDYHGSPDIEDIISVLEVSSKALLEDDLVKCSSALKEYLKKELKNFVKTPAFIDALPGAVFNRTDTASAVQAVKTRIQRLIDLK